MISSPAPAPDFSHKFQSRTCTTQGTPFSPATPYWSWNLPYSSAFEWPKSTLYQLVIRPPRTCCLPATPLCPQIQSLGVEGQTSSQPTPTMSPEQHGLPLAQPLVSLAHSQHQAREAPSSPAPHHPQWLLSPQGEQR